MDNDVLDVREWIRSAHRFSPQDEQHLDQLRETIFSEVCAKDKSLETKIRGCWPDIEKVIALHLATRTDAKVTERELHKWLTDLHNCLSTLSALLTSNELSRNGIWLLELQRASNMSCAKADAEEEVLRFKVVRFIEMFCQGIAFLTDVTTSTLKLFPTKGGRPRDMGNMLLAQGIDRIFSSHSIPVTTSEDGLAVFVVDEILNAFAAPDEKIGTSRANVLAAKKKREKQS